MDASNDTSPDVYLVQVTRENVTSSLDLQDKQAENTVSMSTLAVSDNVDAIPEYRLYKYRFVGALGIFMLDFLGGFNPTWFGPISNEAARYLEVSLNRINWLSNVIFLCYVISAAASPSICHRCGVLASCYIAVFPILIGVWLRYAGASPSIPGGSGYAMIMIGQILIGLSQPVFQIVAVRYSEAWFDLKSRTTFTLVMSLGNPVGSGISQLLSPTGNFRTSLLIGAIVSSALVPFIFIVRSEPPSPPTYSGSLPSPPLSTFLRALCGRLPRHDTNGKQDESYMTPRERIDFLLLTAVFGTFVAAVTAFAILNDQILQPYGYSSATAGFVTAATLLSGLVASVIFAPIFDRVFTHHLGIAIRIFSPIVAAGWFGLIWAVRNNNAGTIYGVCVVIGIFSINLLPIGLELGVEITRNANASAAVLWGCSNLISLVFVLVQSALRGGTDASPPLNMHRSLIFLGTWSLIVAASVFFIHGKQVRRERDIQMAQIRSQNVPSA